MGEKMSKIIYILPIAIICGLIILSCLNFNNTTTKNVPCYDRFGNLIVGQVCEETTNPAYGYIVLAVFITFLTIFSYAFDD